MAIYSVPLFNHAGPLTADTVFTGLPPLITNVMVVRFIFIQQDPVLDPSPNHFYIWDVNNSSVPQQVIEEVSLPACNLVVVGGTTKFANSARWHGRIALPVGHGLGIEPTQANTTATVVWISGYLLTA